MPKGSKVDVGEKKMKAKGLPDHEVYAILNNEGLMHGNKATKKGAAPDKKHKQHKGGRPGPTVGDLQSKDRGGK